MRIMPKVKLRKSRSKRLKNGEESSEAKSDPSVSSKRSEKSKKKKKKKYRKTRRVEPEPQTAALKTDQKNPNANVEVQDNPSMTQFRNEQFIKEAIPQLQQDQAISIPSLRVHKVPKKKVNEDTAIAESGKAYIIDAVVYTIIIAQVFGCFALGFEAYAYSQDQSWNQIVNGKEEIEEVNDHKVFQGMTLNFENHLYLEKAKEHATRDEAQETWFIVFLVVFLGASTIHLWIVYVFRGVNIAPEYFTLLLIVMYSVSGVISMYNTTFIISAVTNIENGYTYAADMLYNFQHVFDNRPPIDNTDDCSDNEYIKGCESYEFAKSRASQLEQIFRLCGDGSRFTRYYTNSPHKPSIKYVQLEGETYYREELKELGFCSRDGFKYIAMFFAILMGVVCTSVPVVYSCERGELEKDKAEVASIVVEQEIKELPKTIFPIPRKRSSAFDPRKAVEDFKAYVEKESDEDLKYNQDKPREVFNFKEYVIN